MTYVVFHLKNSDSLQGFKIISIEKKTEYNLMKGNNMV